MLRRLGRRGMPLVLHPDVWQDRKVVFPTGVEIHMPPPSHNDLERESVSIVEERGPWLLLDGMVLATGQVERLTDFEKGFPLQQGVTIIFRENPTLRDGMPSQAVLSMCNEKRAVLKNAFTMHFLHFKY